MPRVLHICRNTSEACLGAVSSPECGFVVQSLDANGKLNVRAATATIFGKVDSKYTATDENFMIRLVSDTLEAEQYDVWLYSDDENFADLAAERAEDLGHRVVREKGSIPESIHDPFSLFEARNMRNEPGQSIWSQSFCQVDPIQYGEVKVGLKVYMRSREVAPNQNFPWGGVEIFYVDEKEKELGLHGYLQYFLDEDAQARLQEVESAVRYISWGRAYRKGRQVKTQTVIFDIPSDVDAMLAEAKLPRNLDEGGHL